jgi:hypothetical protein
MNTKTYRGRGLEELTELCQNHGGALQGEIKRTTGETVAHLEFTLVNGELHLVVDGDEYTSITNALHALAPDIATHDAEGSEGSGNVANNVIGNYAILKHVMVQGQTMWDILGGTHRAKAPKATATRKTKSLAPRRDPQTTPAQGNLYDFFARDQIVAIAQSLGGAAEFQAQIQGITITEFSDRFGVSL